MTQGLSKEMIIFANLINNRETMSNKISTDTLLDFNLPKDKTENKDMKRNL